MYEEFDSFLKHESWTSGHPLDEKRFFLILDTMVRRPEFNPEAMGDYMRNKFGFTQKGNGIHDKTIRGLVNSAWTIRDFLAATGSRAV